jgi:hypothetical protein
MVEHHHNKEPPPVLGSIFAAEQLQQQQQLAASLQFQPTTTKTTNNKTSKKTKKKPTPTLLHATSRTRRSSNNANTNSNNSNNTITSAAPNNNNNNNSFSACLLTMDDNHFLIEWLAYHYHTLPLRHLIVAVDPRSKTSPSHIFDKWRHRNGNRNNNNNHHHGMGMMVIDEWSDRDYFNTTEEDITVKKLKFPKLSRATNLHRLRQTTFYEECLRSLKRQGRSWTLLIDTDEYLAYNTHTDHHLIISKKNNATVETPGTFLSFIQRELNKKNKNETMLRTRFQQPPCIMIPRLRYGSKESSPEQVAKDVPVVPPLNNYTFNASAFVTLNWRKHAPLNSIKINRVTKAIVDVSQIPYEDMFIENLHHPTKYCSERLVTMRITNRATYLVVRHYLGTWEQFSFRDDVRKVDGMRGQKVRQQNNLVWREWCVFAFFGKRGGMVLYAHCLCG